MVSRSALLPMAVLSLPIVLVEIARYPTAVLFWPVVLLSSAKSPKAVLALPSHICGHWASVAGESAKQASTNGMRKNVGKGERFIECFSETFVVFMCAEDRKNPGRLSSTLRKALAISAA